MKGKPSKKLLDILAAMTDNNEHGEVLSRIASWGLVQLMGRGSDGWCDFVLCCKVFSAINKHHNEVGHLSPFACNLRYKCAEIMDGLISDTFGEDVKTAFDSVR